MVDWTLVGIVVDFTSVVGVEITMFEVERVDFTSVGGVEITMFEVGKVDSTLAVDVVVEIA